MAVAEGLYEPIKRPQIRLITLLPGRSGSRIRCYLRTVSLSEDPPPSYEALSYTWGLALSKKSIDIQRVGCKLWHDHPVTDNLFTALQGLRHRSRTTRTLWVDAICIDQSNHQERGDQVSIMGEVYQTAKLVNIWLGLPTTSGVKHAWQALRTMPLWLYYLFKTSNPYSLRRDPVGQCLQVLRAWGCLVTHGPHKMGQALESCEPCWNSRAWLAQEYVRNWNIYLCYGRTRVHYDRAALVHCLKIYGLNDSQYGISKDLNVLTTTPSTALLAFERFMVFTAKLEAARSHGSSGPGAMSMAHAATAICGAAASDPRDMVYALLGFVDKEEAVGIRPDYTMQTWKVYATATIACIMGSSRLDVLALVSPSPVKIAELPSWVVDFSNSPPVLTFHMDNTSDFYDMLRPCVYWPGSEWRPESPLPKGGYAKHSADLTSLMFEGIRFATVAVFGASRQRETTRDYRITTRDYRITNVHEASLPHLLVSLYAQAERQLLQCSTKTCERSYQNVAIHAASTPSGDDAVLHAITGVKWQDTPSDHLSAWFKHWSRNFSLRHPQHGGLLAYTSRGWREPPGPAFADLADSRGVIVYFVTSNGFLGIASGFLKTGDTIVLVKGSRHPLVLRKAGEQWTFVGLCVINGIMDGELMGVWDGVDLPEETFVLC